MRLTVRSSYSVQVVNSTFWQSEVGNELAQTADIGMVWLQNGHNIIEVSLRSARDDVDVVREPCREYISLTSVQSAIAEKFGGGGHLRASGFLWKGDIESLFTAKGS